jgi:broad specificity phosphatase PhoE
MIVMPREKTLNAILVRHGETQANKGGIAQGQTDSPLTAEGVEATLRKAGTLARFSFPGASGVRVKLESKALWDLSG